MAESQFIEGIENKYPKELLNKRIDLEGCVLSCFYEDPCLMDEYEVTSDLFITKDGRFYYSIAKLLKEKGILKFDDASIRATLSEKQLERYDEYDGYETIQSLKLLTDMDNFSYYIDQLYKQKAVLEMTDKGWDLLKPINIGNKKIRHIDIIKDMTCDEFVDYMESLIIDLDISTSTGILEEEMMDFDDEWLEALKEGFENGTPFETSFDDINGKPIRCYPWLSKQIQGFLPGYVSMMAGYSSAGKSTWWIGVIMALLKDDHKVLIISNEENATKYKMKMMVWILAKYCHKMNITKKKIQSGDINPLDEVDLQQAKEFWQKHVYGNLAFVHITNADMKVVAKEVRKYVIKYGIDTVLYDTFKIQISDMQESRSDLALVRDTRVLDELAQKYNLVALCSLQLAEHTKGKLWLDASTLSNSKQIKEQLENLFLMRNVYDAELDPSSKFYIRPYVLKKSDDGKWTRQEWKQDEQNGSKAYKILFVEKCRSGANSEDTGEAYLLEFDGDHSVFKEVARCKPAHGRID